jgi:SAM-dependent methyltransferase
MSDPDPRWLEQAAEFYDLDLRGHREDVAFWAGLARHVDGPVLEVGCGTGRVTTALARAGVRVTGIDISPAMLDRARAAVRRARVAGRVTLVLADVRTLTLASRFDLIAVPLAGFCHLLTPDDQVAALRSMRRHLAHGGLLALDLPVLDPGLWVCGGAGLRREWRRKESAGRWVEKWSSASPDRERQVQAITYEYRLPDGTVVARFGFELRYVSPDEVEPLLAPAGLRLERIYGSYDLEPVAPGSSRMLVVARSDETGPNR